MSCQGKTKSRCGKKQYSACIFYEKDLPDFSELQDCVTIEETTEELYNLVGEIKEELDLSTLDNECLTFPSIVNLKSVLQLLITTMCQQKEQIEALQELTTTMSEQISDLQTNNCN